MKRILPVIILISFVCYEPHAQQDTLSLCFISDTQNPLAFEKLYYQTNHNKTARKLLFNGIKQSSPNSVFFLGDLVSLGFAPWEWEAIDSFLNDLHAKNINTYAVPGNHEYILFPWRGISEFKKRFPLQDIYGVSKKFGSTAVIIFNSNFTELTLQEKQAEIDWFNRTLQEYETDSSVTYIIAGCHHSPFTNSKMVTPASDDTMMIKFLNGFDSLSKCVLFLSGHSHSYEHFFVGKKDFLVIGGGGGLSHSLYSGADTTSRDLVNSPGDERLFHYITVKIYKKHLWVDLNMCSPDFRDIKTTRQLDFNQ